MILGKEGYACTCAFDGREAADLLEENRYDLILLDVMLPLVDGFELMEYIRPMEIPVIFITAKSAVKDRVRGLRAGAEDYIVKPFEIVELLARVDVVLRRYRKNERVLTVRELEIDTYAMKVQRDGEEIGLTKKSTLCCCCLRRIPVVPCSAKRSTSRGITATSGRMWRRKSMSRASAWKNIWDRRTRRAGERYSAEYSVFS